MVVITLADGTLKEYARGTTVLQVARDLSNSLAKATIAASVNDTLVDSSYELNEGCRLELITTQDARALEIIRHSTAHLLAHAVKRLYKDKVQVTIGPVIEDGFYYDFVYPAGFSEQDFAAIEREMRKIVKENLPVTRFTLSRDDAIAFFRKEGEVYKAEIIADIPAQEELSLYQQGDFTDLCRGPHVPRTGVLKVFKLLKVAGAYWRGDSNNQMLQRIYGTAWLAQEELEEYLQRIEEAKKRDHRKIGQELELFHFQDEAPGMVFWHPAGWTVYQILQQHMRTMFREHGYQEVNTPEIASRTLWEKSGHWEKFFAEMYTTDIDENPFAIKPMSCPLHVEIFKRGHYSYRDLPLRLAEFGCCHRKEPSGSLHGLLRVRAFVQDDAHIFCTEDQIATEAQNFHKMAEEFYSLFGFTKMTMRLATRPEKRVGSDEIWDKAEAGLAKVLDATCHKWQISAGDGAFYGPKIEYRFYDCLNREWQLGTLQLDFATPERLGAYYIDQDNAKKVPVMLHRAIAGTFERFLGILIEHYAGKFPVWLAPKQAVVLNISQNQEKYAEKIYKELYNLGLRVLIDVRNEKIGFKIRHYTLKKIPYLIIIGDNEQQKQEVTVRKQDGTSLGGMPLSAFIEIIQNDIDNKVEL